MLKFYAMAVAVVAVVVRVTEAKYDEPDWGFQSYLGENFTLECNHSTLVVQPSNYIKWQLPDKQMLSGSSDKYVLSNGDNGVVNMNLGVQNVQESDTGVYVCHVYVSKTDRTKRGWLLRGLNLGGHKYRPLFDKYRYHLMIGGVAAAVLFVPLVTACLVYKFRFQTKEQKQAKRAARLEATRHQRHLENNGKGAELSEVAVNDGKGENNPGYDNAWDEAGTRL